MTLPPSYFYPGRMGQIFVLALDEILGCAEEQRILTLAGLADICFTSQPISFGQIGCLQSAIFGVFGPRAGRGISRRVGQASFKYAQREIEVELGLNTSSFRLLPMRARLKSGLEGFARLFNTFADQHVRLEQKEQVVYWHIERCPFCSGRVEDTVANDRPDNPSCDWAVGFLQEALYWVSGGKYFQMEEKKCLASGDRVCTIGIDLIPMS